MGLEHAAERMDIPKVHSHKNRKIREKGSLVHRENELYYQTFTDKVGNKPITPRPIQYLMGLRSLVKRRGKEVLREGWIREAVDKGRNCSECGLCLSRCPYDLPIPDLIKENLQWADAELDES